MKFTTTLLEQDPSMTSRSGRVEHHSSQDWTWANGSLVKGVIEAGMVGQLSRDTFARLAELYRSALRADYLAHNEIPRNI